MAKKKTARKKQTKEQSAATGIRESAEKIWLAGLGALAVAEEEGGKLFRTLVSKGEEYDGAGTVKSKVDDVRSRAADTVADVEAAFDRRVSDALHRVGVPTRDEIADLAARVEELTRVIESRGKPRKKPTRPTTRRKTKRASA